MAEVKEGWLCDCIHNGLESELFIVFSRENLEKYTEDRNRWNQAVLLLGPGLPNVMRPSIDQVLDSWVFASLVAALGIGLNISGSPMRVDTTKLRYGRIFIVHESEEFIEQVIAVFRRFFTELVDEGRVFG